MGLEGQGHQKKRHKILMCDSHNKSRRETAREREREKSPCCLWFLPFDKPREDLHMKAKRERERERESTQSMRVQRKAFAHVVGPTVLRSSWYSELVRQVGSFREFLGRVGVIGRRQRLRAQ
jgi:hypothetical protein